MKIFVTGATGFIGSAVVRELLDAGHEVSGLARSEPGAAALAAAGAAVHRGSLEDLDSLRRGAAEADGVIHTAFIHDFSNMAGAAEADRHAIAAIGDALAGSGRPFVVTSGTAMVSRGRIGTEADEPDMQSAGAHRAESERLALALAERGVRVSLLRLPPSVYGAGDHGFIPMLIGMARAKGVSGYVGDGANRWAGVNRLDAARLYRLLAEKGIAGGRYHGVAEEGVPFREIAEVIGRCLGMPTVGLEADAAAAHFGWFLGFAGADIPASSRWTQEQMGWKPEHPGLLVSIDQPGYFEAAPVSQG